MGSKNRPGSYDCYEKAEPDEPMFILLARDASAPALIQMWADAREKRGEEAGVVAEARECADQMRNWRDHNRPSPTPIMDKALRLVGDLVSLCEDCLTPERQTSERELLDQARRFVARPT